MRLGLVVTAAGGVLAVVAGLLEIAIAHQTLSETGSNDVFAFESALQLVVTTAAGFVFAIGVVIVIWAFAEQRRLLEPTTSRTRRSAR
jgi:hypothetical protein